MPLSNVRTFFSDKRLLVLIALSCISYFVNLGKAPIYILDEAKNAQCAREMLQRHDWVVPTFNQQLRTDKPPLHYFAMAFAYYNWGVSAFTARLFSAVCGLLTIIITYCFVLRYANKRTAFLSGLILLASWHFNFEMRLSVPDPYLILITTAALYSFFIFYTSGLTQYRFIVFTYILLGFGILSKGPVAFILPALAIGTFLVVQKQFKYDTIRRLKLIYGIILMLLVCLPWYILVHQQTQGAWTQGFFFKNNLRRYFHAREKHNGFYVLSVVYVLLGMMPVTFFSVPATRYVWSVFKNYLLVQFCIISALAMLLFFTLSKTQLPNYPIPCYPFLSIAAACYFNHVLQRQRSFGVILWVIASVAALFPAAMYVFTHAEYSMLAFPHLWLFFLVMPAGAIIAIVLYYKAKPGKQHIFAVSAVLFTFIATAWLLNLYAYPAIYTSNPVVNGSKMHKIQEPLVAYHIYNPAFNFYLQQPVKRIEDFNELRNYLKTHPNSQVVTRTQNLKQLSSLHLKLYFMGKDVFENHSTCLLE